MLDILHEYGLMFLVGTWPVGPLGGFANTLVLAGLGLGLSFPLAMLLALARTGSIRWLKMLATVWVYTFRGIPLVMVVFWAYFLLPVMIDTTVPAFATALAAIVVYESAFLAEIVRAGLDGLPKGQMEAARSIGLSYAQAMKSVILPQALLNIIPSLVSQFVSTIKATSIVYIIGVQEITFSAQQINSIEMTRALSVFLVLAAFYFVACLELSQFARWLEARIRARQLRPA
ncbi:MAG: amino acid ABC transporter permease [Candidatus Dactylopiibacterium carminicum]|nr:MAG: amino acid ABC transporter permease [Candidatus Dactylopiibacterium carminicum]